MPIMQDYTVEVEITIKVRNTSHTRVGGAENVVNYSTATEEIANSYDSGQSIPAATTRAIDELHAKVSQIVRIAKDHETKRLSK